MYRPFLFLNSKNFVLISSLFITKDGVLESAYTLYLCFVLSINFTIALVVSSTPYSISTPSFPTMPVSWPMVLLNYRHRAKDISSYDEGYILKWHGRLLQATLGRRCNAAVINN